jgi:hypothetical protein
MAIETSRLPPLEALRNEISKLRTSPMVKFSGRGDVLEILDAYVVEQDARIARLEVRLGADR